MSSPRTREPKKTPRPERPKVKPRTPISLQSVKSLPQDFRFTSGSPSAAEGKKVDSGSKLAVLKENDKKEKGAEDAKGEEDSPYSSKASSREERPPEEATDVEGNDDSPYSSKTNSREERPAEEEKGEVIMSKLSTSRMPQILPSRFESNWGDTSSYVAKKVHTGISSSARYVVRTVMYHRFVMLGRTDHVRAYRPPLITSGHTDRYASITIEIQGDTGQYASVLIGMPWYQSVRLDTDQNTDIA
ncbi:hypothetical protein B296_00017600 [Ensete ventricosum]|uniref:Uncharacterized protein n=1 Tax=Ensete ventricosum TaxID=4639 RepID=A0A426Z3R5_ENSVE|nr:hypothetical protein B296_00017600 [Ensete ventricosum]